MLQHAQMSHAFQSAATGVSFIAEDRRRASRIDPGQGRTYQISKLPELEHAINVSIFSDILELDDEDEQYFSRSLVTDYFTLAQRTLTEMDTCLLVYDKNPLLWDDTNWVKTEKIKISSYYGVKPNISEAQVQH
jgi:osomolarity two-component system phosphorelay intermediate protein YPD1